MSFITHRVVNTPKDSNCYIIFDKEKTNKCIVIDPGTEDDRELISVLDQYKLLPELIILTHEHFDHCWGVNRLRENYPNVKLICSEICSNAIGDIRANYSRYFCHPGFNVAGAEIVCDEVGWIMDWYGYDLIFAPAKGHSSSGIFIVVEHLVFTGDTLIKDIVTETRLKTGSAEDLKDSLGYLSGLKGKGLKVCPGHGDYFMLDDYDLNKAIDNK